MKPKDFQEATARRIVEIFEKGKHNRVLLADEVGLGKTIVARRVVGLVSEIYKRRGAEQFKVVYICSNVNIANQNSKRLGVDQKDCLNVAESRLSMQHLKIYESKSRERSEKWRQQLIPMTPATSFSMTGGRGSKYERALIYALLTRLPAFKRISGFSEFMRDKVKDWDETVKWYREKTKECDRNGSGYFKDMHAAIAKMKTAGKAEEVLSICRRNDSADRARITELINSLRSDFAQISLDLLAPDLVIMDEFQRFKDLIKPLEDNTEEGKLSKRFLEDDHSVKVLLLSATPYKPYSTLEEIRQDESKDHYREFMQVMGFLLYEERQKNRFKTVWRDFSRSLSEIHTDKITILRAKEEKGKAERILRDYVCRTERIKPEIICTEKAREIVISKNDILSYAELQLLMKEYDERKAPVEYVKSAPYLLSFMESYELKKYIVEKYRENPNKEMLENHKTLLLRVRDLNIYKDIPYNNARLETLIKEVFTQGPNIESLLWLPPNKPYYETSGVFSQRQNLSKVLVFSSWEMVPRMIACMLSYESEKRVCQKYNKNKPKKLKRYFSEENDIDEFSEDYPEVKQNRRKKTVRLKKSADDIIEYPCAKLASFYDPLEHIGNSLDDIKNTVSKPVCNEIERIKEEYGLSYGLGSAKDYYCIMRLMDGNTEEKPACIPYSAESLFTLVAIASPGVCAYRLFEGNSGLAGDLAKCFVSLFNKPEAMSVLDVLYKGNNNSYYKEVLRYCAEGNLQAVLDEWAFVLGETGEELCKTMKKAFIQTTRVQVDTYRSFIGEIAKPRIRNHFAVGYFNAKLDDKNVQRTENIRSAFNSPFRPFVLATTSIGQEGLDFHLYCRKICHWNLPSNPVDLEQREGRINRYLCLAIRQTIASRYGSLNFNDNVWEEMFSVASEKEKKIYSDLVPFWCLPGDKDTVVPIERIVPMYPYSKDRLVYERLESVLEHYRLTLGQPRQEELLERIRAADPNKESTDSLYLNLSPWKAPTGDK